MSEKANDKAIVSFFIKRMDICDIEPLYELICEHTEGKYKPSLSQRDYKNSEKKLVTIFIKLMDKKDIPDVENVIKEFNRDFNTDYFFTTNTRKYKHKYNNEEEQTESLRKRKIKKAAKYNETNKDRITINRQIKQCDNMYNKYTQRIEEIQTKLAVIK